MDTNLKGGPENASLLFIIVGLLNKVIDNTS